MSALRAIREKKGFSLPQLAARAGIAARVLEEYEDGRQTIPLAHARLLAKSLWVSIEELMPPAGSVMPAASHAQPSPQMPTSTALPVTPASAPAPAPRRANDEAMEAAGPATSRPSPVVTTAPSPTSAQLSPRQAAAPVAQPSKPAAKERRPATPPPALTEGQMQELLQLAARLEVTREQLEERIGKSLDTLKKPEGKEWVKKLRAMADEIAPGGKIRYGRWPEAQEDSEAAYLAQQQEEGSSFMFKLFNGEAFEGVITNFTPYTITVASTDGDEEVVLRKLAIAYYRKRPAEVTGER